MKNNLKKDRHHLKIALYSKRQKKNIEKREKKTRKIRKSQTTTINIFLLLLFLCIKNIFYRKHIWEICLCYICIEVFSRGRLLRVQSVIKHQRLCRYALVL